MRCLSRHFTNFFIFIFCVNSRRTKTPNKSRKNKIKKIKKPKSISPRKKDLSSISLPPSLSLSGFFYFLFFVLFSEKETISRELRSSSLCFCSSFVCNTDPNSYSFSPFFPNNRFNWIRFVSFYLDLGHLDSAFVYSVSDLIHYPRFSSDYRLPCL